MSWRTCYFSGMLVLGRTRLQIAGAVPSIAAILLMLVLPAAQMPPSFAGSTGPSVQSSLADLDGLVAILPRHASLPHPGWWRLAGADTPVVIVIASCCSELWVAGVENSGAPGCTIAPGSSLVSLHCLLTI
jgi:hypothetical protein